MGASDDAAAAARKLDGVREEVAQHLAHLVGVADEDARRRGAPVHAQLKAAGRSGCCEERDGFVQEGRNDDGLGLELEAPLLDLLEAEEVAEKLGH